MYKLLKKILNKSQYYFKKIHAIKLYLNPYITIGKNFTIGWNYRIETIDSFNKLKYTPSLTIGDNVHIENKLHLGVNNRVFIGNNVVIASNVFISDHNHGYYDLSNKNNHENPLLVPPMKRKLSTSEIIISENVWIGENVSVLGPANIGEGSIIAANSVVKGNIDSLSIYAGIPAKKIKYYDTTKNVWLPYDK